MYYITHNLTEIKDNMFRKILRFQRFPTEKDLFDISSSIRRSTMIVDDKVPKIIHEKSDLWRLMSDNGIPLDHKTWKQTVTTIKAHDIKGVPIQQHDVHTFNSWSVDPKLVEKFIIDMDRNLEVYDLIRDTKL